MKLITSDLLNDLILRAHESTRKRSNHNVHTEPSDSVQRLFVASSLGSYFRPHRHIDKWEFAIVIKGLFDVLVFQETGRIIERLTVGPQSDIFGFELPAGTWHSWIPIEDGSVFFETKQGPYDPKNAAEFAPWSPEESTIEANEFLARLRLAKPGDLVLKNL